MAGNFREKANQVGYFPNSKDDIAFEIDLEEDIGVEIEDLILYSRLRLIPEATKPADKVLWQHLPCFQVFAEVVVFLVDTCDSQRLHKLQDEIEGRPICFAVGDETLLLNAATPDGP